MTDEKEAANDERDTEVTRQINEDVFMVIVDKKEIHTIDK